MGLQDPAQDPAVVAHYTAYCYGTGLNWRECEALANCYRLSDAKRKSVIHHLERYAQEAIIPEGWLGSARETVQRGIEQRRDAARLEVAILDLSHDSLDAARDARADGSRWATAQDGGQR